jgi:hypothetical protein
MRIAARFKIAKHHDAVTSYRETAGSLSMDDRKFLPQVMRVLDKAFGDGGVFAGRRGLRSSAESNQYWNASWMAFRRRKRLAAIQYLWKAWRLNICSENKAHREWCRLLIRYLIGKSG